MPDWSRLPPSLFSRRAIRLAAAMLTFAGVAHAGIFSTPEYRVRSWTTDDGLPHNTVNSVLQDSAGFMWFATLGGLARFDGRALAEVPLPNALRSGRLNVRSFAEEKPGVLDVILASNQIFRLVGGSWTLHPMMAALPPGDGPLALHVDGGGAVWVATLRGLVVRWSPGRGSKTYGGAEGLAPHAHVVRFADGPHGATWIAGDRLWLADATGALLPVPEVPVAPQMIGSGRNGRLWLWLNNRLLHVQDGVLTTDYEERPADKLGSIRHLFEDHTGAVWISSRRAGLLRFADSQLTHVGGASSALSVFEDRERSLWVATEARGVIQLREKSYRVFDTARGLTENVVSSVWADRRGGVWLANRSGGVVFVSADGTLERSHERTFTNLVCLDATNQLWFGSSSGLARWPIGSAWAERMPVPAANPHLLFCARNGDVWFSAEPNEVGYYRDGTVHTLTAADHFAAQEIRAIAQGPAGDIWLGGRDGGLLRWNGRGVEPVALPADLQHIPIHTIFADAQGRLWIGTPRGLLVRDGPDFHLLTEANGLADTIIQAIVEDAEGRLWFGARRGLFYALKSDLVAALRHPAHVVQCHRFGANVGLVGLTPTPNYCPNAGVAADGTLWFATEQGAVVINPSRQGQPLPAPRVVVEDVRLDGAPLPLSAGARVPSGQHRVDVRVAVLSYVAPENVVVRHRLAGIDADWVDTGSDRVASYTNLPPGKFHLEVAAENRSGSWQTVTTGLDVVVVPAWWETIAFRVGAAVLLVLFVGWIARAVVSRGLKRRLRRLEREHAFERERVRIARDLHDELGASLTEVGLAADRLVTEVPREYEPQLARLAGRIRRVATELSGIVWAMNREDSRLQDLGVFLQRYAERLFRHSGIRLSVTGVELIPPASIPQTIQHHLLAATREALNNVLKHARASEAGLALQYGDGVFQVAVSDNGCGFAAAEAGAADGNGLRNMQARLVEVAGDCEVRTAPGAGTTIIFRVPVLPRTSAGATMYADTNRHC